MENIPVKITTKKQLRKYWISILAIAALQLLVSNYSFGAQDPLINCAEADGVVRPECTQDGTTNRSQVQLLEELTAFLESWLNAWGRGDINGYFEHYVANISPNSSLSRRQWEKQRRRSVAAGRDIQVSIELESMGIDDQNVIDVVFLQRYSAKGYQDVTKKQIFLVRQGEGLKITRELVLN